MIEINYYYLLMILGVMKGALDSAGGKALNEFQTGFAVGFFLTFVVGLVISFIKSPRESSTPFVIGIMISSFVGSTLYRILQGPSVYFLARRGYYPTGAIGYLNGSLSGLLIIGLVFAFRVSKERDLRTRWVK